MGKKSENRGRRALALIMEASVIEILASTPWPKDEKEVARILVLFSSKVKEGSGRCSLEKEANSNFTIVPKF